MPRVAAVLASTLVCVLALVAPAQATFPGKNGKLAFTFDGVDTMNPDGSGFTSLGPGSSPAWSPDGKQIAFVSGSFISGRSDVYVMDDHGLNVRRVTDLRRANFEPAWSADGQKLIFTHYELDPAAQLATADLYVVRRDGTGLVNLTNTPDVSETGPAWSSTGRIAFVSAKNVFLMNPDGTGRTQLTHYAPEGNRARAPDWSPDGARLVYARDPASFPGSDPYDDTVHMINADGSGDVAVTGSKWGLTAAWSPDGRYLVVNVGPLGLSLVDLVARHESLIPNPPDGAIESPADWQAIPGPQRNDYKNAARFCTAERVFLGVAAFRQKYGTTMNGNNAFGKCVSGK